MSFMNLPNEPPVVLNPDGSSGDWSYAGGKLQAMEDGYPLFTRISIETLSFCNRDCHFCPLHWSQDERGRKRMTDLLYERIVSQLGALQFSGVAQMFLLSEPTIDVSMKAKLRMLKDRCPGVTTYASSNGDLFDRFHQHRGLDYALKAVEEFYEAGLTTLNLNIYDEGPDQAARYQVLYAAIIERLHAKPTDNKYRKQSGAASGRGRYIALTDMRVETNGNQGLTNILYIKTKAERANIAAPQIHCARPHRHLVIEWDGNVPICCAIDVTDKSLPSMGNANDQTLLEIWNGAPMNEYRYHLQRKHRDLPGCSTCTHRMAFPAIVRKVQPPEGLW
jgi:radical SAM protein with 4Fe4S-binding SPASM domain